MLNELREIGRVLLSKGESEFPFERIKGKGALLAKIIFDLDSGRLECDFIKFDEERAKEYLWVGNAVGQKPQIVLTTDNSKYLLDPSNPKKWSIGRIIEERRFLDENIMRLKETLSLVKEKFFSEGTPQNLDVLLNEKRVHSEEVALYTTCVKKDGKVIDLVKEPGYRKLLRYTLYAFESEEYPILLGRCHICGEEKKVLTNPSYPEGTLLCIYNVDKTGFMSGLNRSPKSLLRSHVVCPDCKEELVLGLKFVERHLTSTIGEESSVKIRVFLIPKIVGIDLSYEFLQNLASKIKDAFGVAKSYKNIEEVERMIKGFMEIEGPHGYPCFLNILFGYRTSSHFSFQYLIQDVPVMRLLELVEHSSKISREAASLFDEQNQKWSIGFEDIFSIFPLRTSRGEIDWRPLVELYNSMLSKTPYPKENIISRAVLFARISRYRNFSGGYNIRAPKKGLEEVSFCEGLFKYNLLLKLLREIGVVEMEQEGETNKIPDASIEILFSKMKYTEWQKALFLLGVLVGKIGIEQYKKGDEKKAILNKINFEGMSVERVKLLSNQVLDGLRNYRIIDIHNEALYGCMKIMMERNLDALKNPIDNVFYILSGYAYATLQAIKSGR